MRGLGITFPWCTPKFWKADGAKVVMRSKRKPTFNTVEREKSFRNPPQNASTYPILNEFVTPHIESFNALFDDSGLPKGDGDGQGLLSLGLKDVGERVVFDGSGQPGTESGQTGWGNRMSREWHRYPPTYSSSYVCIITSMDRRSIHCTSAGSRP